MARAEDAGVDQGFCRSRDGLRRGAGLQAEAVEEDWAGC